MTDRQRWQAVLDNDRRYDGAFFYGVASTGIFCRPSCPSRPPRRDRVRFFPTADAALAAGFRPCKRCRPDLTDFSPGQDVAAEAMALLHRHFRDQAALSAALNGLGLSRRRLAALFQAAYGTTLHGCLGTLRVTEACRLLGGGGHAQAAGATLNCSLEEAKRRALEAIAQVALPDV